MGKYFPKLTQTHVWIGTGNGGGFSCPMLPVAKLGELNECTEALGNAKNIAEIAKIRVRMADLAKMVVPEEYHDNLARLDIPTLAELLAYLMYGDNDDQPPKSAKN